MKKPPILYFHPEGYTMSGPRLMGRNAAGNSFLKGFAKHASSSQMRAFVDNLAFGPVFGEMLQSFGSTASVQVLHNIDDEQLTDSIYYFPGPTIVEPAWQRYSLGSDRYSLCGITHTTASTSIMDSVASWLESPIYEWDAVICTSQVVKDTLTCILEEKKKYLSSRFQSNLYFSLPQLPVIPLGINTEEFFFSDDKKMQARQSLGIHSDVVTILFSGRLSFHAKAHPLAMYQAIARLSKKHKLVLIECGWYANEHIERAYCEAFKQVCPNVRRIILDGREPDQRDQAWASADIFCSLSDNIQETFGLTPVEAMASGLPLVVSDWNGYKDTVRDGVDGFRVPTYQPNAGLGEVYARQHELAAIDYDRYCGVTSQLVAVDIELTVIMLERLIENRSLRLTMGDAGRVRAQKDFDWRTIIPQYEALWKELDQRRYSHQKSKKGASDSVSRRPSRLDPFMLFGSYATKVIDDSVYLKLSFMGQTSIEDALVRLNMICQLQMVAFAKEVQLTLNNCKTVFEFLESGPKTVSEICSLTSPPSRAQLHRSLLWLIKLGFLSVL